MRGCDLAVADWDYYLVGPDGARRRRPIAAFRDWLLREPNRCAARRDG